MIPIYFILAENQKGNTEEEIENLIKMIDNKESDQSIWVKNNLLTTRYDENTNQFWIDVSSKNGEEKFRGNNVRT